MSKARRLDRFGRMAVGQRIRFTRPVMPPTTDCKDFLDAFYDWRAEYVQIEAEGYIVGLAKGYFDAFVTMRFDDGREVTRTLDSDGFEPGGSDQLHVLQEAPQQRSLIRETA